MSAAMWRVFNRLRMDIAYVERSGDLRRETNTGTPRGSSANLMRLSSPNGANSIKVLTLNVWGLFALPHLECRVAALAERLHHYDVVALQEVWHSRERDYLREAGRNAGLIYAHYFACGIGFPFWPGSHGTGLLIMSRLPINDVVWKRFLINGKPYKFQHSDYLAGRGVGLVRLASSSGPIDVYLTHLHAMYVDEPENDEYQSHRVGQAFEMAQFIRATARAPIVIVMGDFNCWPQSVAMMMIRTTTQLRDAWDELNPDKAGTTHECTYGTPNNLFSYKEGISPQRLDYIMFQTLDTPSTPKAAWNLVECSVVTEFLDNPANGSILPIRMPLSDHWGVQALFTVTNGDTRSKDRLRDIRWPDDTVAHIDWDVMRAALAICTRGRHEATLRRSANHRRVAFALLLFPVMYMLGVQVPGPLSFVPFLLSGYVIVEIMLAQGTVTDEITAFSELINEMRHLVRYNERVSVGT